ncbi:hypothetical protein [Sphaerisporangium album]|nr:hypothetical protein [Sphaerisporangium album]
MTARRLTPTSRTVIAVLAILASSAVSGLGFVYIARGTSAQEILVPAVSCGIVALGLVVAALRVLGEPRLGILWKPASLACGMVWAIGVAKVIHVLL